MTRMELGSILRQMYDNALDREATVMVHLFGVMYADEIRECDGSVEDVVAAAGISTNYSVEVRKGMRLAKYVQPKPGITLPQATALA